MTRLAIFAAVLFASPVFSNAGIVVGNPGDRFQISFTGSSSFLLRTMDDAEDFAYSVEDFAPDPTLSLTAGETYTFHHTGGAHPFVLLDDEAPIASTGSGVDGSEFTRTVTDNSFLGHALDYPDLVVWPVGSYMGSYILDWTPEEGTYYYTCGVGFHNNMAGQIVVQAASALVPEPSTFGLLGFGLLSLFALRRRR